MATDELDTPLGQTPPRKRRRRKLPVTLPQALAGGLGLFLGGFVLWTLVADNPLGGEPMAVAGANLSEITAIKPDANAEPPVDAKATPSGTVPDAPPAATKAPDGAKTVTIIDGTDGSRKDVVIPGAAPKADFDQKLVETSRHGLIPRIGPDGTRPADAYARPPAATKPNVPRIAIVMVGLGLSSSATADAISQLPPPVSFALAPYAGGIEALAARARGAGHEILVQAPMEPFDYPDNDPGPQTLLTSLSPDQNIDRLHWTLSRVQGYVGVVNLMGARFTASEVSFAPVLREIAKRGLIYVEDGSSPRSVASQLAGANSLPFARAEVAIDTVPALAEIDKALARLEAVARDRGLAVGVATTLPVSVAAIARWAKAAESRGFQLVPISVAAARPKSS